MFFLLLEGRSLHQTTKWNYRKFYPKNHSVNRPIKNRTHHSLNVNFFHEENQETFYHASELGYGKFIRGRLKDLWPERHSE